MRDPHVRAFDNLTEPQLQALAQKTIVTQTREMNAMLDMLGR